ncbi:hypothetical protein [Leifsonia sp. Le1]|uniref:hypothetical protein n=1 Tax=Leifsonia sp. Le1 TaxID=3404918 RepID=UPI003EBB49F1
MSAGQNNRKRQDRQRATGGAGAAPTAAAGSAKRSTAAADPGTAKAGAARGRRAPAKAEPEAPPATITPTLRFAASWRRVGQPGIAFGGPDLAADPHLPGGAPLGGHRPGLPGDAPGSRGVIVADLIRPEDLLALTVTFTGCTLTEGANPTITPTPAPGAPAPAPDAPDAAHPSTMTVDFAFQHLHEEALYEAPTGPPALIVDPVTGKPIADPATPSPPGATVHPIVGHRPARGSRLVFAIPDGESIPFTSEGILAAITRLEPVLHPLAAPSGTAPAPWNPGDNPAAAQQGAGAKAGGFEQRVVVGKGIVATLTGGGVVLETVTAAQQRKVAGPVTLDNLVSNAKALGQVRASLSAVRPVVSDGVKLGGLDGDLVDAVPRGPILDGPILGGGFGNLPRTRPILSDKPDRGQTAIEAPFRLMISPTADGRWAHAVSPVQSGTAPGFVELWHSRLGVASDDPAAPDERDADHRVVRAIWTRDRDSVTAAQWQSAAIDQAGGAFTVPPLGGDAPFRASLNAADRHRLVRQTSESWLAKNRRSRIDPLPVGAKALWLSGLGATLDLHGAWPTLPYSLAGLASVLAWDHQAPFGRDQYVRVAYPGYLFPLGHKAALIKVTERKMKAASGGSYAGLYQRKFIVLLERTRSYAGQRDFPFASIELQPSVTPVIDDPGPLENSSFWPTIGGQRFRWVVNTVDRDTQPIRLSFPMLWVSESVQPPDFATVIHAKYDTDPDREVAAHGQRIAFAPRPSTGAGDAQAETQTVRLLGTPVVGSSTPTMSSADVVLPAVQHLSATPSLPVSYAKQFLSTGLDAGNPGQVWANVLADDGTITAADFPDLTAHGIPLPSLSFGGAGSTSGTDKGGGFVAPNLPIRGVSALSGPVGDIDNAIDLDFNPVDYLKGALPKLFGLVDLVDVIEAVTGEPLALPKVVSQAVQLIEGFLGDVQRLRDAVEQAVRDAQLAVDKAADRSQDAVAKATAIRDSVLASKNTIVSLVTAFPGQLAGAVASPPTVTPAELQGAIGQLGAALDGVLAIGGLPVFAANQLASLKKAIDPIVADVNAALKAIDFLRGLASDSPQVRFRFEWKPEMRSWPAGDPILSLQKDSLVIAIDGRASATGDVTVDVLAELRDFQLNLLPGAALIRVPFEHMSFKAGSNGKTDVDVVLGDLKFVGLLSFVEVIKELIPFDGFSDPPFLDVSPSGLSAGFTLALPNVAIGVFNLSNMSLGADVQVPFLGKSVTVGFNFCTRERPFTLAVVFLGGGGWFGMRIGPKKLEILEIGLEAGACLAVDLGVASGSISAMIGIYIRLEADAGSLTGYFRLRGEVDVLGLISASIELYMELVYQFNTGKMIGRATITVQVKVLFFSASVQISAERQFAGSNGDPSFREVMCEPDGTSPAWSDYCEAFGAEGVQA